MLADPFPLSAYTMVTMGLLTLKEEDNPEERDLTVRDVQIGGTSSMQMALERSVGYSGRVEAARATLDQVKVEDIDTNVAVLKVLFSIPKQLNLIITIIGGSFWSIKAKIPKILGGHFRK
jgi:hypothetical protein